MTTATSSLAPAANRAARAAADVDVRVDRPAVRGAGDGVEARAAAGVAAGVHRPAEGLMVGARPAEVGGRALHRTRSARGTSRASAMSSRSVRSGAVSAFSQRLMVLWSRLMRSPRASWERPAARRASRICNPIWRRRWGTQSGRGSCTRAYWNDLVRKSLPAVVNLAQGGYQQIYAAHRVARRHLSVLGWHMPERTYVRSGCSLTPQSATPQASPTRCGRVGRAARPP